MRFEQIQQFITVAKRGNFRRASGELGISQPALTRSIQNLEQYFGVPLFDRLSNGVVLTEYGKSVMDWAEETVSNTHNIKRYVDLLSDVNTGTLAIGTGTFFADSILAEALGGLTKRYPALSVKVIRDTGKNAEQMILYRQVDIFFGWIDSIIKSKEILVNTFETGPIVIFCRRNHPVLKIYDPDFNVVFKYPFAGPVVPELHRLKINSFRHEITGEERPFFDIEFDSYPEVRRIVSLSDCIGALPESNMAPYFKDGSFVKLPVSLPGIKHEVSISYLKKRTLLPAADYFINEILKVSGDRLKKCVTEVEG